MLDSGASISTRYLTALSGVIAATFALIALTPSWRTFELKGFDALSVATAPGVSSLPITIVAIDEASFKQIGMQWPWPRSMHARLVDQLSKSGALVIALDVLLSEASQTGEDEALAEAIDRAGNVVIASDRVYQEAAYARQWIRVNPLERFVTAGAGNGFAAVSLDTDLVVRRMPDEGDVFWRAIVERANRRQPGLLAFEEPQPGSMIRYEGRDRTFPYVSYYQVLKADTHLPPEAFKDQIVIVGRDVKASTDQRSAQADLFATPFTGSTGWLTPGAEIHASILETALRGDAVVPAKAGWGSALVFFVVAAGAFGMRRWRPMASGVLALGLIAALGGFAYAMFVHLNVWVPVFAPMSGVAGIYVALGGVAFVTERRHRAETRRAFSLYVSPEVVDHVLANPQALKLGGERREITCFFSDLEGFTTITERIGAEQVARVLNMHFTRAGAIIKRHGGTLNKFIGDAIMAFWGAPLADPEQAARAVRAASEIQADLEELRAILTAQGLPQIRMRIGIHSCAAVVGNLGSADRFEYTAIGDGVNLAARLEGVNKLYNTSIILSGETAKRLAGTVPVRPVDSVIVKGKSEPVDIFTPCDDLELVEMSSRALALYRNRRWVESVELWIEIRERFPSDRIAALFIERIEAYRVVAPAAVWSGAVELEKL